MKKVKLYRVVAKRPEWLFEKAIYYTDREWAHIVKDQLLIDGALYARVRYGGMMDIEDAERFCGHWIL